MSETKDKIITAASKIVQEGGVFELTLDAVAKRAGISKGGLLYHYPSKEALVKGMVEHLIENYIIKINEQAQLDEQLTGKWTRAFVQETFLQSKVNKEKHAGLLAALAINPELLHPIREAYDDWQHRIEVDGLHRVDATILRLAADGLWFTELFGLAPLDKDLRREVLSKLVTLSKGEN